MRTNVYKFKEVRFGLVWERGPIKFLQGIQIWQGLSIEGGNPHHGEAIIVKDVVLDNSCSQLSDSKPNSLANILSCAYVW
jgi:hypothetical protein